MAQQISATARYLARAFLSATALVSSGCLYAADPSFPTSGILPKTEIGALRFLDDHPQYDGRGIVVAIFDTGVAPGAPGLQQTPDGRPKVIDMVDASGSGDVDTSTVRQAEDRRIQGLSGRTLTLGSSWSNPSGDYHLGIKRGYELFPESLVDRLKTERLQDWQERQRQAMARLQRRLSKWKSAHPNPSAAEQQKQEELETRLDQLHTLQQSYQDPGPIYDCVVFHDGQDWRAAIDTDTDGDLAEETLLTDFRKERQYAALGEESLLNVAVNIYDEGNLLSLVTDCGGHGTHVAGIVGGYFPDQPELNGLAPGVQIVSVKIGDTRLDCMETGTGIVRGLQTVRRNDCDLINMSYGEPTSTPNEGRLIDLISEWVHEEGVLFVASAGNAGPALSSVGAPGGTTSAVLGIGAYVSPAMMEAGYAMRKLLPGTQYTWSSRGPASDGDLGVNLSAPGGAIAPVPAWTLQRQQLMNGTSMASPNACGGIALLLSGLKQEEISYSPPLIHRAVMNTAKPIEGVAAFGQGSGLLQVEAAYAYLTRDGKERSPQPRYEVTLPKRGDARGIYLREPDTTRHSLEATVRVNPVFPDPTPNRTLASFEQRLVLECDAPWVELPQYLVLMHGGRSFDIKLDPTGLPPGAHYAEVQGIRPGGVEPDPLFRLPITVIRPIELEDDHNVPWEQEFTLQPGQIERQFFKVPSEATWAELTLRPGDLMGSPRVAVHTVQLLQGDTFEPHQARHFIRLQSRDRFVRRIPVTGGRTMELCLAGYWSNLEEVSLGAELTFRGLDPADQTLHLTGGEQPTPVRVNAGLTRERLAPRAEFTAWRRILTPEKAAITPLNDKRDRLPDNRQIYQLILTYPFQQAIPGQVTPRLPALNGRLYEAEYASQLWMLFDAGKRLITVDDAWPSAVQLDPGRYTLRLHFRHEQPEKLEKLTELPLHLERTLQKPIGVQAYPTPEEALNHGTRVVPHSISAGQQAFFYLAAPNRDKIPAAANQGDMLVGNIHYSPTDAARPGGYRLTAPIDTKPTADSGATKDSTEQAAVDTSERRAAFRAAELKRLRQANQYAAFDRLAKKWIAQNPDHLPFLVQKLKRWDDDHRKAHLPKVVDIADRIIQTIDTDQLARYFGRRHELDSSKAKEREQRMNRQKRILVDTLYRKGRALAFMDLPSEDEESDSKSPSKQASRPKSSPNYPPEKVERLFESNFQQLRQWADTTDEDNYLLHIRWHRRHERYGQALALLNQHLKQPKTDPMLYRKRIKILKNLGWSHWVEHERHWLLLRFPDRYPRF